MRINVDLYCPHCLTNIKELGATNLTDDAYDLGSITVCGNCGGVSEMTTLGLMEFLDFASLSKQEQKDLKFAIKAVKANAKRFRRK